MGVSATALDDTLAALADPARRRTVDLLRERPRRSGELAEALGLAFPAMSKHLAVLRRVGLVEETHPASDARIRIYTLRPEPMEALRTWLEQTEQMWTDQLAGFKAHVETGE